VLAAAFTCISKAVQYPFGSAHAGIGERAALSTAGVVCFSATTSADVSPVAFAESTAFSALSRSLAGPRVQASYSLGQLTSTAGCVSTVRCLVAAVVEVWLLQAASAVRAPAAARRARGFRIDARSGPMDVL
jgi:hypothetical protein